MILTNGWLLLMILTNVRFCFVTSMFWLDWIVLEPFFSNTGPHETHYIMMSYFPLLHILEFSAESLFNAFATAAFFKFVVFSIFEMRYLLAIWKASRPLNSGEGWEIMRRELSVLYSRFCKYKPFILLFALY
jgi:hypothetical protein